jgi:nucleoside 2-deoxyribosyltransferase
MKKTHKIFFAIPFDAATLNQYERIRKKLEKPYPTVTSVIGNKEVGPSPQYSDIASFKNQNRELTEQFAYQIRDADIVVADLTHNNPNVHVELGIALTQNKNVLRVTGRSVTELGFDIRNLDVFVYKTEAELLNCRSWCVRVKLSR